MRSRARRRSHRRIGEPHGTALRNHHSAGTCREGGADNRAEILGILDAVQQNKQPGCCRRALPASKKLLQRNGRLSGYKGHDALMFTCSRGAIYLRAILKPHRHGIATRQAHDLFHTFAVPPVRDHDRLDGASSVESFSDSMNAGNFFHSGRSPELARGRDQSKVKSSIIESRDRLGGDGFAASNRAYTLVCFRFEVDV